MVDYLGWLATAVVLASYGCRRSDALKRVQMAGALIWMMYGVLIQALPIVVANALVFGVAGWSLRSHSAAEARPLDTGGAEL